MGVKMTPEEMAKTYMDIADGYYGFILVTDGKGKIQYVNENVTKKYSLTYDELLELTIYDLIERGILKESAVVDTIATGKAAIRYIENETEIPVVSVSKPLFDEHGKIRRIVAFSQDETVPLDMVTRIVKERKDAMDMLDILSAHKRGRVEVVAESPEMKNLLDCLKNVAKFDTTIALYGESGVGKEVVANFIHKNSNRRDKLFFPFNCAAIPADLMESEFFGYERGSFTGAMKEGKAGIFELVNDGTLFLDEIGDLPLVFQAKLLRVIDNGEIRRIGGNKIIKTNVRIITATNRNLSEMVEQGAFRADLFYRPNTIPITIPPLRKRREDIPALAELFLQRSNRKYGINRVFAQSTLAAFKEYHWPGNVRELRNLVEQLVLTAATDGPITWEDERTPFVYGNTDFVDGDSDPAAVIPSLREAVKSYEREFIINVMAECDFNVAACADRLQIHRSALYRKINDFKILIP